MPMLFDDKGQPLTGTPSEIAKRAVEGQQKIRAFFPAAEVRFTPVKREATVTDQTKAAGDDSGGDTGKPGDPIEAVINTKTIDRYGTIVDPAGCDFKHYAENPILLWQHGFDFGIGYWPVGTVVDLSRSSENIVVQVQFDIEGAVGAELDRMYRKRILRGFSVGFIPKNWVVERIADQDVVRFTEWELLELSAVSVPANPEALARAMSETKLPEMQKHLGALRAMPSQVRETLAFEIESADGGHLIPPKESLRDSGIEANEGVTATVTDDGLEIAVGITLSVKIPDEVNSLMIEDRIRSAITREINDIVSGIEPIEFTDEELNDYECLMQIGDKQNAITMNFNGVSDPKEFVEKLEKVMDDRGIRRRQAKKEARDFPIEWQAGFSVTGEFSAASDEIRRSMAAVTVSRGSTTEGHFVHHHADGRINWRALASCMARLLTKPTDLTAEQNDEVYEHLADHYRHLGVEVPEAGAKSEDQAYDLALEGRVAHVDENDYAWIFSRVVISSGVAVPEFTRADDPSITKLFAPPSAGRLTDSGLWGKRQHVKLTASEELLSQMADMQRQILSGLEVRAGAKFSKQTKGAIVSAAEAVDSIAKSLKGHLRELSGVSAELRELVADAPVGDGDGTNKSVSGHDHGDGGSDGDQRAPQSKGNVTRFARPLAPRAAA